MSAMNMKRSRSSNAVATFSALLTVLALTPCAQAGDGERALREPLLPKYRQECGACHAAFPPGLLPAASWQRLMRNLPRHFGTDASLDPATVDELSTWLIAHAGSGRRAGMAPPDDRITRSAWFLREHDEVGTAVWKRPAVKSAANCAACHPRADQGAFNEHDIRIPR
jgi:cytochrome c553